MAQKTPKFAIFDYFESETVEVGRVSDIKWDTEEHDLEDVKDNGKVVSVCWSIKGPTKKGGKSKAGVFAAKVLNFHGMSSSCDMTLNGYFNSYL